MAQNKNELKINCLNNSVQFSPKLLSPNLLLTDYSKNNDNENTNNSKIRLIKKNHLSSIINKTNIGDKNKIVVNYNFSKINQNLLTKNSFPDKIKSQDISKNNKSIHINTKNKKNITNERNVNDSMNGKIVPYSSHVKEIKDHKPTTKKMKLSESKEQNITKNKNFRKNRNLNLSLTDFASLGGTEYIKFEKDIKQIYNLNKSPEILIKRKFINTTKNKLNEKIFGRMNYNNYNYNDNYSNLSNTNNLNNRSVLSNKITNNSLTHSAAKRKMNKRFIFQSNDNVLKINQKYSVIKKLDNIKNNLNQQIIEINNNFNKIVNIMDKDIIKKHQLIFDIIQNSLFKFITLLENPKEKEIGFDIIQKLNDFFKKQDNIINNIIKKNDDLNDKNKKYKEINKNIEKENLQLIDKCDNLEKKIEKLEKNNKNDLTKLKHNNDTENKLIIKTSNLFENEDHDSIDSNDENEDDDSSVNTEDLESIRFFDKIIMKKHSFSKAHIPELEIKQIKLLNDEFDNKENIKINNKYKNNKNKYNNKGIRNGKKIENKNTKTFGYTKIAVDKKIRYGKQFHKIK